MKTNRGKRSELLLLPHTPHRTGLLIMIDLPLSVVSTEKRSIGWSIGPAASCSVFHTRAASSTPVPRKAPGTPHTTVDHEARVQRRGFPRPELVDARVNAGFSGWSGTLLDGLDT